MIAISPKVVSRKVYEKPQIHTVDEAGDINISSEVEERKRDEKAPEEMGYALDSQDISTGTKPSTKTINETCTETTIRSISEAVAKKNVEETSNETIIPNTKEAVEKKNAEETLTETTLPSTSDHVPMNTCSLSDTNLYNLMASFGRYEAPRITLADGLTRTTDVLHKTISPNHYVSVALQHRPTKKIFLYDCLRQEGRPMVHKASAMLEPEIGPTFTGMGLVLLFEREFQNSSIAT